MVTFPILAGTFASMLHVISGPDHMAAVTPLAIETKRKAWKIGLAWGFGHLFGMLLIGVLFLLFKDVIPVEAISKYSEQLVAIVLIGIGVWAFYQIFKEKKNAKSETKLQHNSEETILAQIKSKKGLKENIISSLGIGFLHGLAGVSHFLLLLPVLGFKSKSGGIQYIVGFAIGTVLAMSIYAYILGQLTAKTKEQNKEKLFKGIRFAGGIFAIVVGFYWLYLGF